jgi:hypothetical protein
MRGALVLSIAAFALLALPAVAQDVPQSVSELLKNGYEVKGVMPSNAGPGILLEHTSKGTDGTVQTDLIMCFVAETPSSPTIKTQYCKRVE